MVQPLLLFQHNQEKNDSKTLAQIKLTVILR